MSVVFFARYKCPFAKYQQMFARDIGKQTVQQVGEFQLLLNARLVVTTINPCDHVQTNQQNVKSYLVPVRKGLHIFDFLHRFLHLFHHVVGREAQIIVISLDKLLSRFSSRHGDIQKQDLGKTHQLFISITIIKHSQLKHTRTCNTLPMTRYLVYGFDAIIETFYLYI